MRILNTSADRELLLVRSEYLWTLGFDIENAFANARLLDVVKRAGAVDIAVLCYTLTRRQKISLVDTIHRDCPSTQVVELYLADAPVTSEAIEASSFRHMVKVLAACIGDSGFATDHAIGLGYLKLNANLDRVNCV